MLAVVNPGRCSTTVPDSVVRHSEIWKWVLSHVQQQQVDGERNSETTSCQTLNKLSIIWTTLTFSFDMNPPGERLMLYMQRLERSESCLK